MTTGKPENCGHLIGFDTLVCLQVSYSHRHDGTRGGGGGGVGFHFQKTHHNTYNNICFKYIVLCFTSPFLLVMHDVSFPLSFGSSFTII